MTATHHHAATLQALEQYRFILNLSRHKIDPNEYYRLTTYGNVPAIQQDPNWAIFRDVRG